MKRLAIITTHPIQYNAPLFALIAARKRLDIKVYYTWGPAVQNKKYDPGFGKNIQWDIPLLDGYDHEFVYNRSTNPGSHHFYGIDNPGLIKTIEAWGADVVLIYGWAFKSHLKALRYFHGRLPVLFRGDSTLLNEKGGVKKIARRIFLRWVYRHVDYALYAGTNNMAYFLQHGLKKTQLVKALHAVDNDRFAVQHCKYQAAALQWKRKLGISENELTVLFAGKLEPVKNPGFMIELGKQLNKLPVKIIMVGNGSMETQLKYDTENDTRFIFIDFQNQQNMPVVYRMADVYLMPSKSETWGLGVNEAMACGRVILLSDKVGSAADLVTNGSNGMVFGLNDTDACIAFIKTLVNDRTLLQSMQLVSLKKIKDFTFTNIAMQIEQLGLSLT